MPLGTDKKKMKTTKKVEEKENQTKTKTKTKYMIGDTSLNCRVTQSAYRTWYTWEFFPYLF